jgi:CHAT domain-containing protein
VLLRCTIVLCLISTAVCGQQLDQSQIKSQDELAIAVISSCRVDLSCSHTVLEAHKDLVSAELWQRFISLADYRAIDSFSAYQLALDVALILNDKRLSGLTHYKIGWYQFGQGKIADAIESYLQSKQLLEQAQARRDLIYVLADLGTLNIFAADYVTANQFSEDSLAVAAQLKGANPTDSLWPDEYGIATALANLGNIAKRNGDYEKARGYFQQSLQTLEAIETDSKKYRFKSIDNLWDIGQSYVDEGDYLHALEYLHKSIVMATESRETARAAGINNSLGILYLNQRDYAKAIDFFQNGLKFATDAKDRFKEADILLNLGVAYQFSQDYPSSLIKLKLALDLAKQINYSELLVLIQEAMGVVYSAQAKYGDALHTLDAALLTARGTGDKTRIAELLWRRSQVNLANHDASKSIENATEAINIAEQLSLKNVRYLALTELGKAYRSRGENDLAMQTFKKVTAQIEEMRNQVAGLENERQLFFEDKVVPYHEVVDMLLTSNKAGNNEQALLTAESAKARVLLDVFGSGKIDLGKVTSEPEKEEERKLNQRIVDLNNQISQEKAKRDSDSVALKNFDEQLRAARTQYETFQDSLYAAYPELNKKQTQTTLPSLGEINNLLDEKTAFLEYVVADSKTYLLVLTKGENQSSPVVRAYPIAISATEMTKRTNVFRDMITTQSSFADEARNFYDLLLKPAEQQLKGKTALCLVPDGILWDLPFQALEPRNGHYLLEDYAISYAPSLSVLKEMFARTKTECRCSSLLAFGNPTMPAEIAANIKATYRGENLGPLPDAEMEVDALKSIWGPYSSRVLIGANARKNIFRSESSRYSIIHLATHGILDDTSPMYSRLVMSRADDDPRDDGLLEARDIMRLDLHADLVVLSACNTARGRFGAGEGMIGMSWAFFVAGVPTMVASQWKVDSASTAKLMIDFHKRLKESPATHPQNKAIALQQAALSLMKDARYRHPYFWAGFVMVGKSL